MKISLKWLPAALVLCLGCAHAAPGDLNLSFGSAGIAMTAVPHASGRASGVVTDRKGRLLVAGWGATDGSPAKSICILARYLPNGQLDRTFGPDKTGVIKSHADANFESGFAAVHIDSKNRIVVGGRTRFGKSYTFAMARYFEDGTLDEEFGDDGIAHTVFGADAVKAMVEDFAFDSSDRLVAGGVIYHTSGVYTGVLVRYKENGHLDKEFGGSGIVDLPNEGDYAMSVAVDSKNRVLVGGENFSGSMATFVSRYLSNGVPDASFGTSGTFSMPFDSWIVNAFALDAADRPVIGRSDSAAGGFTIIRLSEAGALDSTFGSGAGYVTTSISATPAGNLLDGIAIDGGGRILAGGGVSYPGDGALVRYLPDGTLDASFGAGGIAILPTPASASMSINTLTLSGDNATVAGFATVGTQDELLLAQFNLK